MTTGSTDGRRHLGFSEQVISKIVDPVDLQARLGSFPRVEPVVMCHGTFDLVHPGHLRHLAYAKSKGSILVVSITTDEHVTKANMRPYVPEELRALNLAALELVDFVVVDKDPNPISLIRALQPDIFVKGYEYGTNIPPKTASEKQAVEAFGGRMLFSPGDFVLSSSAVIENDPPKIGLEKLLTLMQVEGINFADLYSAVQNLSGLSVTIIGDIIVDSITSTSVIGGYRKTPTPSVRVDGHQQFVGGAGIVAKHIAAAGARVNLISVIGDDELGRFALADLEAAGVTCNMVTVPDFMAAVPEGLFTVADSQVASRWGNILDFAGCDLITPNEQEVRFALGDQDSVIRPLGSALYDQAGCKILMLKVGARGMLTFRDSLANADRRSFFTVDALARDNIADPVGSGDALLAYATLTQVATKNEAISSIIGTIAAGLECEFEGNIPVTPDLVSKRLRELETASEFS